MFSRLSRLSRHSRGLSAAAALGGGATACGCAAQALAEPSDEQQRSKTVYRRLQPAESLGLGGSNAHFACFRGTGERAALSEVLAAADSAECVILGETHDDPVAHQLELYLLMALQERRPCVLSLEMFERDVQTALDEYLRGLIREADMLQDARPWANYEKDYRPMVEFAKAHGMPVAAANVPRRYVGAIGRASGTLERRDAWPASAYELLPPLPLPKPSPPYMDHLLADPAVLRTDQLGIDAPAAAPAPAAAAATTTTAAAPVASSSAAANAAAARACEEAAVAQKAARCPYIGLSKREGLVAPMMLWDAGMAHSIAASLAAHPERLVVHVCGSFHCEWRLGIAEMLEASYRPGAKALVVVICPEDDCDTFDAERHGGRADFVVLTDARLPRSHDYFRMGGS